MRRCAVMPTKPILAPQDQNRDHSGLGRGGLEPASHPGAGPHWVSGKAGWGQGRGVALKLLRLGPLTGEQNWCGLPGVTMQASQPVPLVLWGPWVP